MAAFRSVASSIAVLLTSVASASEFDGTLPLTCTTQKGHDCLPAKDTCGRLKPETRSDAVFRIDFAKQQVRSPYRTSVLPMLHTSTLGDSLVIQGADVLVAWNAIIDKKTGGLTIAVADNLGAYVAFGQCKAAEQK